jgi:PHP family Zn ribbon phosphoesterase
LKIDILKKADLHNHTLLSPCGSLEMTPHAIVQRAKELGIDILGIADHNTTRHVALVKKLADKEGIFVLQGAEVNTKEEVHCLCFFPSSVELDEFQNYIDRHMPDIPNRPGLFGDQVQINEAEEIIYDEKLLLLAALDQSIEEVATEVHRLGGLFIPAHINRKLYGLCTQLGFLPPWLDVDAVEVHPGMPAPKLLPENILIVQNSDAHHPDEMGQRTNLLDIDEVSFETIKNVITKWKEV